MTIYSGFTHWKLCFSKVMLVHQRVSKAPGGHIEVTLKSPDFRSSVGVNPRPVHFFNSVASLLSQLARNVVEQSLEVAHDGFAKKNGGTG